MSNKQTEKAHHLLMQEWTDLRQSGQLVAAETLLNNYMVMLTERKLAFYAERAKIEATIKACRTEYALERQRNRQTMRIFRFIMALPVAITLFFLLVI